MSITVTVRRAKPDDARDSVILHRHTRLRVARHGGAVLRLLDIDNRVGDMALEAYEVVRYDDGFPTFDSQVIRR